ncbi:DUF932 domain-containing protein [Ekhidna sp. MALMAid0563]|uniref:DUF932 domain-containing protein n=1 Tax=Ekhidna sp. MALMAid0563 TaxID=3143937 RepID=UPI0032DE79E4
MPKLRTIHFKEHEHLTDIFFPVEVQNSAEFQGMKFASNISHCVVAPTLNKVLGYRTDDYRLALNEEFIMPVYERLVGIFGDNIRTNVKSFDDRQFYVELAVESSYFEITKDDAVCPMITLQNSYDGGIKQSYALSYYRKICSNGLHGFSEEYSVKVRHSKGNQEIDFEPLFKDLEKVETRIDVFKELTERRLLPDELDTLVSYVNQANHLKFPKSNLDTVAEIATNEAQELAVELNPWIAYNAFNNVLNHGKSRLFPQDKVKIDKNILDTVREFSKTLVH